MKKRNITYYLILLMALSSCVKEYTPKITGADMNKYVVTGQVKTDQQTQTVNVSMTASIKEPKYIPVTGCDVSIYDNQNHRFVMVDMGNGDYTTMIDPKFLVTGQAFRVAVVTPDGDSLLSDYDTLQPGPPIDSLYYLRKDVESPVPGQSKVGIQFYINFQGTATDSHYYRWNVYETWEYHAEYPLEYYYDGTVHHVYPPDYSNFTCWRTRKIPEIFTLSTSNLSQNHYEGLPLQFVNNTTPKLANGYSMLLEQIALSKEAYTFWDRLRINSTQQGGLYEKQPISIIGNLHDANHPDREVLGFFSAESVRSKRIFIREVPGLVLNYVTPCHTFELRRGFSMIPESYFPAPLMAGKNGPLPIMLSKDCVDCRLQGGTNVKPSFWPNK